MKAYEAWIKAKDGQQICRVSRLDQPIFKKSDESNYVSLVSVFGIDFSADDWEIVKEKHSITFTNEEFSGMIGSYSISKLICDRGLERPQLFTKICLEWEA